MKFSVKIKINDLAPSEKSEKEIARLFRVMADQLENGDLESFRSTSVLDDNGQRVERRITRTIKSS